LEVVSFGSFDQLYTKLKRSKDGAKEQAAPETTKHPDGQICIDAFARVWMQL
jgi:hypothetical protein